MTSMTDIMFTQVPRQTTPENDWVYSMRRDMQEILPGLFLGPYAAAKKSQLQVLLANRITHIVCIRQDIESHFVKPNFPEHFRYLVIDIADRVTENIIQHFPKVKCFLDDCLNNGGNALVHGNAGISRSAALVIAYIMEKYVLTYREAYLHVQQKRFCIQPNEGFAQQLKEYEPIYRAKQIREQGEASKEKGLLKRKRLDEDNEMDTR